MGFSYQNGLPHQMAAIQAVLNVFNYATKTTNGAGENPTLSIPINIFSKNIKDIQLHNGIEQKADLSNILDISMETGTGKTYTYTQTMFEMHRLFGVYKFVIVMPTLSIKAGTENFLSSKSLKEHFKLDFNDNRYGDAEIQLYVMDSRKNQRGGIMPDEIVRFVNADNPQKIHVLLLNMGMVNSKTMNGENANNDGSVLIKDMFDKPFDAIASVKPILIIDEPHRFDNQNKTWGSLMNFKPQYILRYGATFNDKFHNLIYRLSAMDAFNQDLVKGIVAHVQEVQGEKTSEIRFINSDGNNATFEFKNCQFRLIKGESFQKIHEHIHGLFLENLNKSTASLSNGVELKKGDGIYPFSYSNTVLKQMIQQAVRTHFENEKKLLERPDKIKPLTLFFIDDIKGYRDSDGEFKNLFEKIVKHEATIALKNASVGSSFYQSLQTVLKDISATHGGYFSKDNNNKNDEKILKEINEILHDKESLLSLDNPRRFIFSKWTLREGWDNPNIFCICKLRSSGSETSKLQEVGRGLRLPVNEFMSRVTNGDFKLHYFVDSSESNFIKNLIDEIKHSQPKNQEREIIYKRWNDKLFQQIKLVYPNVKNRQLGDKLENLGLIDDNDYFINEGFKKLKEAFPLAFNRNKLKKGKIVSSKSQYKNQITHDEKNDKLKSLWELVNKKAIWEYHIEEKQFADLLKQIFLENKEKFIETGIIVKTQKIVKINDNLINFEDVNHSKNIFLEPIVTMSYYDFLKKISNLTYIQLNLLHKVIYSLRKKINFSNFLNDDTVYFIANSIKQYLLKYSTSTFIIEGKNIIKQIDLETTHSHKKKYLTNKNVIQFKMPTNVIKIKASDGQDYAPSSSYIINNGQSSSLYLSFSESEQNVKLEQKSNKSNNLVLNLQHDKQDIIKIITQIMENAI